MPLLRGGEPMRRQPRHSATRTMTVTVDATQVSPLETIRASAGIAPLVMVTGRMLIELADELGGQDQAARFLADIAE